MGYKQVNIGALSQKQLHAASSGKPISLSASQVSGGGTIFYTHPENAKKIQAAKRKGTGTRIQIMPGAIQHDLAQGGSLWSWLGKAAKTGYKAVKDNWGTIQPLLTKGIDQFALPMAMRAAGPYAPAALIARQGLRAITGVGIGGKLVKGSPEAKARMAAIRGKKGGKQPGGSFRLN